MSQAAPVSRGSNPGLPFAVAHHALDTSDHLPLLSMPWALRITANPGAVLQLGMALLQHVLKLEDTNMADEFIVFAREQVQPWLWAASACRWLP